MSLPNPLITAVTSRDDQAGEPLYSRCATEGARSRDRGGADAPVPAGRED